MYEEMSKRHFLSVAPIVSSTLKVCRRYSHLRPYTRITPFGEVGAMSISLMQLPTFKQLEIVLRLSAILRQFSMRCGSRNMEYVFLQSGSRSVLPTKGNGSTWSSLLGIQVSTAIKYRLTAVSQLPHNANRETQLAHYSDLADRCIYMKDLWRNNVMHTRANFNRLEAAGILQRVRELMQSIEKTRSRQGFLGSLKCD